MSRTVVRSFALLVHVLLFNLAADILAVGDFRPHPSRLARDAGSRFRLLRRGRAIRLLIHLGSIKYRRICILTTRRERFHVLTQKARNWQ